MISSPFVVPKEGGLSREENCELRTPSRFPSLKKGLNLALKKLSFDFIKLEINTRQYIDYFLIDF